LEQLLKDAGLSVDWKETILPIVKIVSEQVEHKRLDILLLRNSLRILGFNFFLLQKQYNEQLSPPQSVVKCI